ncbi:nucleotidyl transferase AbiEii/AbiGii toxin family protein [Neolewinella agarilytica]|uniref:nucleotidyl transferase AbiEii/AbiGii toxin family protein n=1 Tax=Neolewinella agarilytica TaxID=478744 RepID=UPI002354527E|nr:nucleotidyl transferase AbiEii/AbiGii toxin family protein [Neolewinella agarilytica]
MMELQQIKKWYPENLHAEGMQLLREYLQYEILQAIFQSKLGHKYTFLGGTCLRIAYGTERFSEDLDFDNVGLGKSEFEDTAKAIKRHLELRGYKVELKFAYKGAYHCNIRFPALLFDYGLSGHKEAKLMIKLDTEKQHFEYKPEIFDLNKFGIRHDILITPLALLASQKVAAVMGRKRAKGRDFYDLHFILQQIKPDYDYLHNRFQVASPQGLRSMVQEKIDSLDFDLLAKDVMPFLMQRTDVESVRNFSSFWANVAL